jgi:hypothetical protein
MDIVLQHFFSLFILSLAVICSFSQPAVLPSPAYQFKLEQHVYRDEIGDRRRLQNTSAPLFEGIGTHYSFIWVGSPPQRVSVIMDTGSHHTAFPCVGCNCGPRVSFTILSLFLFLVIILTSPRLTRSSTLRNRTLLW